MNRSCGLLALFFLLLAPGCAGKSPVAPSGPGGLGDPLEARKLPEQILPSANALVQANNRFALDIYAQLRTQSGNLFFSPFSVSTAFAMTYAGAGGRTQSEMAGVFHFPEDPALLHPAFQGLLASLDRGAGFGGYELRVANRLWPQKDIRLLQPFLDLERASYGAVPQALDFEHDAEGARKSINSWVSDRTNRKISELFPGGSLDPSTRLVLTNAIYFKGLWARQFDRSRTRDSAFHLSATESRTVPMMFLEDTLRSTWESDPGQVWVLELPYRGKDLSMLIVLPLEQDGLEGLEASLTPGDVERWTAHLWTTETRVALPRFSFSSSFKLPAVLQQMGMRSAFDPGSADFSAMDGRRDLFIGAALHQAFISVDEEGSEAAAATGVGVRPTSVPPAFVADHPFLFLIRDNVTGSTLFMGRVMDPSQ